MSDFYKPYEIVIFGYSESEKKEVILATKYYNAASNRQLLTLINTDLSNFTLNAKLAPNLKVYPRFLINRLKVKK